MAAIDGAKYAINIRLKDNMVPDMDAIMKLPQWNIVKKSKSGEKEVDIKPLIRELKYSVDESKIKVDTVIACGSRENLSPTLLSEFIKMNIDEINKDAFVDIERIEMYGLQDKKLVPLYKFFSRV